MTKAICGPTIIASSPVVIAISSGSVEIIDQLASEWRQLCAETAEDQPFYRPEWIAAYFNTFAPRAKIALLTARSRKRLRLVLPLIEETGSFSKIPLRKLRSPVDFRAGRFDATCTAEPDGEAAIQTTWQYLRESARWDLLQFTDTLEGGVISQLAALARTDGLRTLEVPDKPSPYVSIPVDPELRKQLPANARLRRELKSVRRQLANQGTLKFYRVDSADRAALDLFYQLESSGWKGRQDNFELSSNKHGRPFFDEVAAAAARFGYFTLYMLELNDQLIAAQYGFTCRDCYYSAIVAYNEDFKHLSPGHLIIEEIIRDCAERGVRTYDTTGENQEWKMRWTKIARPRSHHFIFRGPLGNLAYTVGSKLKPALGRWLTRQSSAA